MAIDLVAVIREQRVVDKAARAVEAKERYKALVVDIERALTYGQREALHIECLSTADYVCFNYGGTEYTLTPCTDTGEWMYEDSYRQVRVKGTMIWEIQWRFRCTPTDTALEGVGVASDYIKVERVQEKDLWCAILRILGRNDEGDEEGDQS